MMVFAASRRSRRRSSLLRGGHGGGLCPFVWRSRRHKQWRSFYKKYKNSLTANLASASYYRRKILKICAPSFAVLAPPGILIFTKSKPNNPNQQAKKVLPPLAVGGGHGGQRRPAVEVTEFLEVICGDRRPFGGQNDRTANLRTGDQARFGAEPTAESPGSISGNAAPNPDCAGAGSGERRAITPQSTLLRHPRTQHHREAHRHQ